MNPTSTDPNAPLPPPPPPSRASVSCDRHPDENFIGFCPSCLCERLTTLDNSSTGKFYNLHPPPPPLHKPSKPTSFFPELRRTKSFSASKNDALGIFLEPQRKSCDLNKSTANYKNRPSISFASSSHQNHQKSKEIESFVVNKAVFEEEDFNEHDNVDDGDEIRPLQDSHLDNLRNGVEVEVNFNEIMEEGEVDVSNLKPMKDHIEIDFQEKKSSGGRFWSAASVLSKKWHKWRQNQKKIKKRKTGENFSTLPVEKPISRQFRETQSEIADYGFGRRSCDIDPRFSLDAGRISFDDPRYSVDEPRASRDGYLIGRSFTRIPPMVSVTEDDPTVHVSRSDMRIPVEEPTKNCVINVDEGVPGGTVQTREYYTDCSSRRKSLDRSSSIRQTAAAVVAEIDGLKMTSNAKVSPTDYFQGAKFESRDSNSNSLRDDLSENFELGRKDSKKSRSWHWRLWDFTQRRNGGSKDEDYEEKSTRVNGLERSLSESWRDLRRGGNGNGNVFRSNSSVSWRNANPIGGSFGSVNKSGVEANGHVRKRREEFVMERNRSARYSPNGVDNGLLRFYLTPLTGSRRIGKIKPSNLPR